MGLRRYCGVVAPVVCLCAVACGDDDTPRATADAAPVVIATTTIWADVVRNVACGDRATVETIIPAGGDPHSFEPSLQDREHLGDADLVVANGAGLEPSLEDTVAAVEHDGTVVFRVTDHVTMLHGDPHVWMDPTRVLAMLPALGDALVAAGLDAGAVSSCRASYAAALTEADADVAKTLAAVPAQGRSLVTSHEALDYFAERYGFTVVGAVIPGGSSLGETNAADLEQLAAAIDETGVRAIFSEEQHSATDIDALAAEVGDVRVISLYTDALGPPGSGAETYLDLLRTDARLIADGLAG
jgi:zinc/manganese transport system substrate-binding protein